MGGEEAEQSSIKERDTVEHRYEVETPVRSSDGKIVDWVVSLVTYDSDQAYRVEREIVEAHGIARSSCTIATGIDYALDILRGTGSESRS